jgi:pyridoxine 5-phosphate synthase
MPCQLSVNVNAIAYLRNRRDLPWPSVEGLSRVALDAGAHGITVHPRPDERHIRRIDVTVLRKMLRADYPQAEFNIEGYPDERFLALCEIEKPDQVTLVPDDPSQPTSDHGWDFGKDGEMLKSVIARMRRGGMRVSLFVDPLEADAMKREFAKVVACGKAAEAAGLGLNAGHDLTRENLPRLVAALPNLLEVSIGHAITADALSFGMAETVRLFCHAIGDSR